MPVGVDQEQHFRRSPRTFPFRPERVSAPASDLRLFDSADVVCRSKEP